MQIDTSVTIRRASLDDAAALASLGATTFTETFGHLYPPEDLRTFLVSTHSVATWQRNLADPRADLRSTIAGLDR